MKKSLGFLTLWAAGSAAAVSVAWAGVTAVDDGLRSTESLSEVTIADGRDAQPDPTVLSVPTTVDDSDERSVSRSADDSSPTSRSTSTTMGTNPVSTPTTAQPGGSTSSTSHSSTSTTPTSSFGTSTTAETSGQAAPAQTLTFHLTGGSTAINYSATGVSVAWATPNAGYAVSIEPEHTGIKVEFRSDAHRSRIDAWWSGGPQHSIREEAK